MMFITANGIFWWIDIKSVVSNKDQKEDVENRKNREKRPSFILKNPFNFIKAILLIQSRLL